MIPFKEIIQLAKALPKCGLQATKNENFCWIIDKAGQKVGSVHFNEGIVNIFEEYEYADQVRAAIGEEKFEDIRTNYAESLYQEPKG